MRIVYYFVIILLFLSALLALGIFYAWSPAVKNLPQASLHEFSPLVIDHNQPRAKLLKVVTYNIGYASGEQNNKGNVLTRKEVENNLSEIVATLKKINADLVFLQEVDFNSKRSHHINQFKKIADALDMPFAATVITWNHNYLPWPFWPFSKQFGQVVSGQAVLSRFPILNQRIHPLDKPATNPFWYNWFSLDRKIQELRLEIGPKNRTIFHVHLEAYEFNTREMQTRFLAQNITQKKEETLFAIGDFNSVTNITRTELSILEKSHLASSSKTISAFQNSTGYLNAETKEQLTFPSWAPDIKIDHIFYPENLKLKETKIEKSVASDHLPVWAVFELKN